MLKEILKSFSLFLFKSFIALSGSLFIALVLQEIFHLQKLSFLFASLVCAGLILELMSQWRAVKTFAITGLIFCILFGISIYIDLAPGS